MFDPVVLATTLGIILNTTHHISNLHKGATRSEYDFIVVGSGSGGGTVAGRLSEIIDATVLLLEAGGEAGMSNVLPALAFSNLETPKDWAYRSTPQQHSFILSTGKVAKIGAGKVAGGSSSINAMMYVRGNKKDFDNWAELGNDGWSYNDILKYFKMMENNTTPNSDDNYRGRNGPIYNSRSTSEYSRISDAIVEAGCELGYQCGHDYNGESQHGFSHTQYNILKGERQGTAMGYLHPNRDRPNFDISLNSQALKILFDKDKRAYGVYYQHNGIDHTVLARKEIIISAGSIGTAKLLQLSGVGPKEHLLQHNITLILDSPVGNNLQDHPACAAGIFTTGQDLSKVPGPHQLTVDNFAKWLNHKPNPLGNTAFDTTAFLTSSVNKDKEDYADIQLAIISGNLIGGDNGLTNRFLIGIGQQAWEILKNIAGKPAITQIPILLHPKSRGTVRLNSADPYDPPIVDPNYFSYPEEVQAVAEGLRVAIDISKTNALKPYHPKFFEGPFPGCEQYASESDEQLQCLVRTITMTTWHYAGTCKMGPKSDKDAVVDNRLRMYGVKGLRVADASIMPLITSGNTNVPTIMIGEKCADMIKKDWKLQTHSHNEL